ncbi:MAG TPA: hypothetical protein DDZ39_08595 [Flavobacteriaceae bacterium]|nr:hypothetical protein [Flavobacteriaceae bacterium]
MYSNKILHDLVCINCKEVFLNGITSLETKNSIEVLSHQKLVVKLDNFQEHKCEKCKTIGKWIVSKIFLIPN